eukprot:CAMPEP_0174233880 /NCGR_PEP_ID=MMETSP0417-20130205/3801_1 /TAXON_ID=242541 /ORGANISM="Mayorella sp, Strain BSH-02190019" /LENGTH=726 /DNA_ID=CAMNT_0015312169 /DNA_START=148 /DNA_END=2328 /DNA_ORIENTATION=-
MSVEGAAASKNATSKNATEVQAQANELVVRHLIDKGLHDLAKLASEQLGVSLDDVLASALASSTQSSANTSIANSSSALEVVLAAKEKPTSSSSANDNELLTGASRFWHSLDYDPEDDPRFVRKPRPLPPVLKRWTRASARALVKKLCKSPHEWSHAEDTGFQRIQVDRETFYSDISTEPFEIEDEDDDVSSSSSSEDASDDETDTDITPVAAAEAEAELAAQVERIVSLNDTLDAKKKDLDELVNEANAEIQTLKDTDTSGAQESFSDGSSTEEESIDLPADEVLAAADTLLQNGGIKHGKALDENEKKSIDGLLKQSELAVVSLSEKQAKQAEEAAHLAEKQKHEARINALKQKNAKQLAKAKQPEKPQPPTKGKAPKRTIYDAYSLRIVYERDRTGLEETKDFPIRIGAVVAGRYKIVQYIGSAAFSKAVQCVDLLTDEHVCIKIIKNDKEFLDQSLDEIKILKQLNMNADPEEKRILRMFDYFYYKEHLFIVCELLRDNLYEFYKYNRESGSPMYFNFARLKLVAKQVLTALQYTHQLGLIHCDLKPENILIQSYSRCEVKVIDFGSSCYKTDHLGSYVQSRAYRAPEVILGMKYSELVDVWSLGCILFELLTGQVLFVNESLPTLLARVSSICGPFPLRMKRRGRYSHRYFNKQGDLYERRVRDQSPPDYSYLYPKQTSLCHLMDSSDELFVHFLSQLLQVDPNHRPNCTEALNHPWFSEP